MRIDQLDAAIVEAERFLKAAREARRSPTVKSATGKTYLASGPRAASAKRASMDLTRALVGVRRSDG